MIEPWFSNTHHEGIRIENQQWFQQDRDMIYIPGYTHSLYCLCPWNFLPAFHILRSLSCTQQSDGQVQSFTRASPSVVTASNMFCGVIFSLLGQFSWKFIGCLKIFQLPLKLYTSRSDFKYLQFTANHRRCTRSFWRLQMTAINGVE